MADLLYNGIIRLHREQLLARPISEAITGGEAKTEVEWKLATPELIDTLSEEDIQYYDYRKRFAKEMLAGGSVGIIGYINREAAHIGWMSFDQIFSPPFEINLGPGWVYFHRTRTAPKFRGLRLQGAGIKKRLEIAAERGITKAVNMVDTDNTISLYNYKKMGFQEQEKLWALELFGRVVKSGVPEPVRTRLGAAAA